MGGVGDYWREARAHRRRMDRYWVECDYCNTRNLYTKGLDPYCVRCGCYKDGAPVERDSQGKVVIRTAGTLHAPAAHS